MNVLTIQNLSKNYGSIKAVNDLNLEVNSGEVFGILGPNGSGKTTTLGIVMGIIRPTNGTYTWFGENDHANLRKRIGTLLETPNFYPFLSAVRNLKIVAHIKKIADPNIDQLLELVNLSHRKNSAFRTYSLGMKQRLAIAASMIGDPDVLIFDEPTNGLDPEGIQEVRVLLSQIAERGKTIIMASHILDEVEKVCNKVAIIKKGKLLATGSVGAIINPEPYYIVAAEQLDKLHSLLAQNPDVTGVERVNGKLKLSGSEYLNAQSLNKWAFTNGMVLTHLELKNKSLEEEFLEITRQPN